VFQELSRAWAAATAAQLVALINQTTMDKIKAEVIRALQDQVGARELAKRIKEHVNGIGNLSAKARALMIARTETHRASSFGADESARASGLEYVRVWISAEDARTRPDHAAAHGQKRGPNEPFSVGGYSMMRPGEGPAAQTINCRCVLKMEPLPLQRRVERVADPLVME
jgi:SPP1 gp7 family putative phage head morphogenesis protein